MICIVSSSAVISGAEIVLKDYLLESEHNYVLIIPKIKTVIDFFSDIPAIKRTYYLPDYMSPRESKLVSRGRNILVLVKETIFIKRLIQSGELDDVSIIYGSNSISCMSLGVVQNFCKDKAYILHIHDMMSACSFTPLLKLFCNKMTTVTVSEKCKEELVEIAGFDPKKVTVIYNGIGENDFTLKALSRKRNKYITMGFAGNIIPRKGVLELVKAFEKIYNDGIKAKLKVSYHLKEKGYYDQVNNILLHYPHSYEINTREQMNDFYQSIDVLVVPSIKDPLPTTVLEAMACGLVVIGSNVDGIPEMLGNGYLFEPGDVESLYNKLKWVIEHFDRLSKECLINNPLIIKNRFLKQNKVRRMDRFFEQNRKGEGS